MLRRLFRVSRLALLLAALFFAGGTAAAVSAPGARHPHHKSSKHRKHRKRRSATGFAATIRRTEHGIPHIEARSWAGLGYGFGYAFAQDNLCRWPRTT